MTAWVVPRLLTRFATVMRLGPKDLTAHLDGFAQQRLGLFPLVQRAVQVGKVIEERNRDRIPPVLGPREHGERLTVVIPRAFVVLATGVVAAERAETLADIRVMWPERGPPDVERTQEQPACFVDVAVGDDRRHGEQHPRRPLVPVAVDPLMAFERFVEERTRTVVFARELARARPAPAAIRAPRGDPAPRAGAVRRAPPRAPHAPRRTCLVNCG